MSENYVFKLQFKSHIYFFRAESEYAFFKWMEVKFRIGNRVICIKACVCLGDQSHQQQLSNIDIAME